MGADNYSGALLTDIMAPFPCLTFGWFSVGYHANLQPLDGPLQLHDCWQLLRSCHRLTVLARLLAQMPTVLTTMPRGVPTFTPVLDPNQLDALMHVTEFAPCSGGSTCACREPLLLWRAIYPLGTSRLHVVSFQDRRLFYAASAVRPFTVRISATLCASISLAHACDFCGCVSPRASARRFLVLGRCAGLQPLP